MVARLSPQPTPLPKGVWKELRLGHGFGEGRVKVTESRSGGGETQASRLGCGKRVHPRALGHA